MSQADKALNLCDLPSVLDTSQAAAVLRVDIKTVRFWTTIGLLRRLRYTRRFRYDQRELLRFMELASDPEWWAEHGPQSPTGGDDDRT